MIFATIAIALQSHFPELKQFDPLQGLEKPLAALSWMKPESPDKSIISALKMKNNTSALVQEFNNFKQRTCTIAPVGNEYLAILRTAKLNLRKTFTNRDEASEYLWRNAAIAFFCYVDAPAVIIEVESQQIVTASDAACNLWNENLIGFEFSQLSSDRAEGDRFWNDINQHGYVCGDINFVRRDGRKINATLAGENIKSPAGNNYIFLS